MEILVLRIVEHELNVTRIDQAETVREQAAHHPPDLVVQEAVRFHVNIVELEVLILRIEMAIVAHIALLELESGDRFDGAANFDRVASGRSRGEGGEIVATVEQLGGLLHPLDVDLLLDQPIVLVGQILGVQRQNTI